MIKSLAVLPGKTRREFMHKTFSTALSAGLFFHKSEGTAQHRKNVDVEDGQYNPSIPSHLPKRLALCSWQFAWFTSALSEEPYGNLEKVMEELKGRDFNAIRIDAGLNLCFQADGTPRGEVTFCQAVSGYSSRLRVLNGRGGGCYNILQRIIQLMKLARQYDIYVILTSWEYMHTQWIIADTKLRSEIRGVVKNQRLMRLARQMDRLICILKDKDLHRHIAYVEPHNEVNSSDLPKKQEGKRLHEEAIAFLRDAHPDILISGDMSGHHPDQIPENTQVYDNHGYVGSEIYYANLFNRTVRNPDFDPGNPKKIELLNFLLEEDIIPFAEFKENAQNLGETWMKTLWLYHNLDIARFDRWMLDRYDELEPRLKERARRLFGEMARGAIHRNLPLALEEGGFFYAPLNSCWEESEKGLSFLEFLTDLAIKHKYWVFLPTTYNGPEEPLWYAHPKWLRRNNLRFQRGIRS